MKDSGGVTVAFQGERGAYSEEAIEPFFGPKAELRPCRSLSDVFEAVERGSVNYGTVPVENSLEGSVNETYDLLMNSRLRVCGEVYLRIVHCLIAGLGMDIKQVRSVYSHPQALAQCRSYLGRLGCEVIPTYDTAGSVKMIKEGGLAGVAAVASERAANYYGMKILARGIGDSPNNYTRFFVLSKREGPPSGKDKTSVIFSVKHVPGALHRALEGFAVRGINLTKIESRPTKRAPWEYNFYLDFEGHVKDGPCREALNGLREKAIFVKVLGSYPRARWAGQG